MAWGGGAPPPAAGGPPAPINPAAVPINPPQAPATPSAAATPISTVGTPVPVTPSRSVIRGMLSGLSGLFGTPTPTVMGTPSVVQTPSSGSSASSGSTDIISVDDFFAANTHNSRPGPYQLTAKDWKAIQTAFPERTDLKKRDEIALKYKGILDMPPMSASTVPVDLIKRGIRSGQFTKNKAQAGIQWVKKRQRMNP